MPRPFPISDRRWPAKRRSFRRRPNAPGSKCCATWNRGSAACCHAYGPKSRCARARPTAAQTVRIAAMPHHERSPVLLARYLALAWLGLIVYGSLHPFSGWRTTGAAPLAFLHGGWPRYWTVFDLVTNVAVYVPLGLFLTLALRNLPWRFTAPVIAVLVAASVSFGLETIQNW